MALTIEVMATTAVAALSIITTTTPTPTAHDNDDDDDDVDISTTPSIGGGGGGVNHVTTVSTPTLLFSALPLLLIAYFGSELFGGGYVIILY